MTYFFPFPSPSESLRWLSQKAPPLPAFEKLFLGIAFWPSSPFHDSDCSLSQFYYFVRFFFPFHTVSFSSIFVDSPSRQCQGDFWWVLTWMLLSRDSLFVDSRSTLLRSTSLSFSGRSPTRRNVPPRVLLDFSAFLDFSCFSCPMRVIL